MKMPSGVLEHESPNGFLHFFEDVTKMKEDEKLANSSCET